MMHITGLWMCTYTTESMRSCDIWIVIAFFYIFRLTLEIKKYGSTANVGTKCGNLVISDKMHLRY